MSTHFFKQFEFVSGFSCISDQLKAESKSSHKAKVVKEFASYWLHPEKVKKCVGSDWDEKKTFTLMTDTDTLRRQRQQPVFPTCCIGFPFMLKGILKSVGSLVDKQRTCFEC